jgi:hypothetical protein
MPLTNVLDWAVTDLVKPQLSLRRRSGGAPVPIPLPAADTVTLILAHIPYDQLKELPPGGYTSGPGNTISAEEFDAYYQLLRRPDLLPAGHVRVPYDATPALDRCAVRITLTTGDSSQAAPGTYSCMLATAQKY